MGLPKRKVVFQSSIFRCYVSFREGICLVDIDCTGQPPPTTSFWTKLSNNTSVNSFFLEVKIYPNHSCKGRNCMVHMHLQCDLCSPETRPQSHQDLGENKHHRTTLLRFAWAITLKQCTKWVRNIAMDKDFKKIKLIDLANIFWIFLAKTLFDMLESFP